jgi:ABC-type branched-subunit amino acid transport system substrate-binding protein
LSPPRGYAEGANIKWAAEIAAEEISAQGGILGRPVAISYADTRGMPAEGRTAAERLIQQSKGITPFGEFHSPVALAEMEVYHKYGIPFMACDVWPDQITAKGYPEVFRNAPAVSLIDVTIGESIVAAGFKNVAIIAEKDDVGLAVRTLVAQVLTKAGVKLTAVDADPYLTDLVMSRGVKIAEGTVAEVRANQEVHGPMPVSEVASVLIARRHHYRQRRVGGCSNGTGKSTLLSALFGFLPAQHGQVRFGATSLEAIATRHMGRHGIIYLPQRPSLFPFLSVG